MLWPPSHNKDDTFKPILNLSSSKEYLFLSYGKANARSVAVITFSSNFAFISFADNESRAKTKSDFFMICNAHFFRNLLLYGPYVWGSNINGVFAFIAAIGVVERLERDFPDKKFVLVSPKAVCANMKWIHLEDILNSLEAEQHEIDVDPELAKRAYAPIEKMVSINS